MLHNPYRRVAEAAYHPATHTETINHLPDPARYDGGIMMPTLCGMRFGINSSEMWGEDFSVGCGDCAIRWEIDNAFRILALAAAAWNESWNHFEPRTAAHYFIHTFSHDVQGLFTRIQGYNLAFRGAEAAKRQLADRLFSAWFGKMKMLRDLADRAYLDGDMEMGKVYGSEFRDAAFQGFHAIRQALTIGSSLIPVADVEREAERLAQQVVAQRDISDIMYTMFREWPLPEARSERDVRDSNQYDATVR